VTASTPDALWSSPEVRVLRPWAVVCERLHSRGSGEGRLRGIDLHVGVGARLLLVAMPDASSALLLRILAGLSRPRSGRIQMAGTRRADGSPAGWGRRIAYVGPGAMPFPWMSAAEALELSARLLRLSRADAAQRIEAAVMRWRLLSDLDRPLRRVGPAYVERVAMASALIGDPEIVLLDEPLRAVEPTERIGLLRLPGRRCTVILASRYPASEAGAVNQVALIQKGIIAVHAPISALTERALPLSHRGIAALADALRRSTSATAALRDRSSDGGRATA
jgi:ABC-2 type transport system ATP-binding protein